MTNILELAPLDVPHVSSRSQVRLDRVAPDLWRVIDRAGLVIGHLQIVSEREGTRYRARRFHATAHGFRDLGDFWNADDAVDVLRLGR
ncbi:hypothetical protein [Microbacterium jejuense]|uniref:hypothetical protein n=1 Tax=Microbacterium jejuense TaxID=1263637 RepID=UPI0031F140AF